MHRHALALFVLSLVPLVAMTCEPPGEAGFALFESPAVNPLALTGDGRLVAVNPLNDSISVVSFPDAGDPVVTELPVGVDPVSVAVRPKAHPAESALALVANHVSDSISVVDLDAMLVVQTLQDFADGAGPVDGITTTNEPVGVVFAGPDRAFVALDEPNQVLAIDFDADRVASFHRQAGEIVRLDIRAQSPRALAVDGDRLYVAAFESGNRTTSPTCSDPATNGGADCRFVYGPDGSTQTIAGTYKLEVVTHPHVLDRDVFVFDLQTLEEAQPPLEGVGTLLYGIATDGAGRVYVANTDARNQLDGLNALANRMFVDQLTAIDCAGACAAPDPAFANLDATPTGPVVTPYGIAVSGDGSTIFVTAAGAGGAPGDVPGLAAFGADGSHLDAVAAGPIPQGVVVASDASGAPQTAYVWNSNDQTVTRVDVSDPGDMQVVGEPVALAATPLSPTLAQGRRLFRSSRASTSGLFSCESCHPNAHTDQLLWTINGRGHPSNEFTENDPESDPVASLEVESRVTQSVRGLRDTLPLHWDGALGMPGVSCNLDPGAPDTVEAFEKDCFRDLVDASLAGVMCLPPLCEEAPPGQLAGALDDAERDALAAYLTAVSIPPGPARAPDDRLSDAARFALERVADTCTGNGCHSFPLQTANFVAPWPALGVVPVTRFQTNAPTLRGLWDRRLVFANGGLNSPQALEALPDYEPDRGLTSRDVVDISTLGNSMGSGFEDELFRLVREQSIGLSGWFGRQLLIDADNVDTQHPLLYAYAEATEEGRISAVAHAGSRTFRYREDPELGWRWFDGELPDGATTEQMLALVVPGDLTFNVVAELPAGIDLPGGDGFADAGQRQPLLFPEPGFVVGLANTTPATPVSLAAPSLRILTRHVAPGDDPRVYIDGEPCPTCAFTLQEDWAASHPGWTLGFEQTGTFATLDLDPGYLAAGSSHVVQIQRRRSYFSNEVPIRVDP